MLPIVSRCVRAFLLDGAGMAGKGGFSASLALGCDAPSAQICHPRTNFSGSRLPREDYPPLAASSAKAWQIFFPGCYVCGVDSSFTAASLPYFADKNLTKLARPARAKCAVSAANVRGFC